MKSAGLAALLCTLLMLAGCSVDTSAEGIRASGLDPTPVANRPIDPAPEPSQVQPGPAPTAVPLPTVRPTATATARPLPTPTPADDGDGTPIVIQGDGWTVTEGEVDAMADFIEETHDLAFNQPLKVQTSADIGAGFAAGFEPFGEDEWHIIRGLGLAERDDDRLVANQVRLDRVRGVCCDVTDVTTVIVELQPTKLATELIIVHELTHALHTQHPELFEGRSRRRPAETPRPDAAAFEGVPQFVAFAYLALAPQTEQAEVIPDLPIIRDDMVNEIGAGPARHLNFAYATGPAFVEAVVAERGLAGLTDLINEPPQTTEQVLFPEKYLRAEAATEVATPELGSNAGAQVRSSGTIGAALLMFVIADAAGPAQALALVEGWSGDSYVTYQSETQFCVAATIEMDGPDAAVNLGEALQASFTTDVGDASVIVVGREIELVRCGG